MEISHLLTHTVLHIAILPVLPGLMSGNLISAFSYVDRELFAEQDAALAHLIQHWKNHCPYQLSCACSDEVFHHFKERLQFALTHFMGRAYKFSSL